MLDKRLENITREDLDALVSDKHAEGRSVDYKRDLNLSREDDKKELARDVAAFANAGGGHLIFGIEEEKDAAGKNLGRPAAIVGVECPNFDAVKLRVEAIVRDNVAPRIQVSSITSDRGQLTSGGDHERARLAATRLPAITARAEAADAA